MCLREDWDELLFWVASRLSLLFLTSGVIDALFRRSVMVASSLLEPSALLAGEDGIPWLGDLPELGDLPRLGDFPRFGDFPRLDDFCWLGSIP